MKEKCIELGHQPWTSQMVINSHKTKDVDKGVTWALKNYPFRRVVDLCQYWSVTPQAGNSYWSTIHREWEENHR